MHVACSVQTHFGGVEVESICLESQGCIDIHVWNKSLLIFAITTRTKCFHPWELHDNNSKKSIEQSGIQFYYVTPKGNKVWQKNNEPGSSNSNLNLISND